jgi:hypothetical protein
MEVIKAEVHAEINPKVVEAKHALHDDFLDLEYDVADLEALVASLYRRIAEGATITQRLRNNIQTFSFKSKHKRCGQCGTWLEGQDTWVVQNGCGAVSIPTATPVCLEFAKHLPTAAVRHLHKGRHHVRR